eukprot:3018243-Rhodomonas_salina.1
MCAHAWHYGVHTRGTHQGAGVQVVSLFRPLVEAHWALAAQVSPPFMEALPLFMEAASFYRCTGSM